MSGSLSRSFFAALILSGTAAIPAACGGGGGPDFGPSPPGQAASGPGGKSYAYSSVAESEHGSGDDRYWIFEPQNPGTGTHPLVVFLHGYGVMLPDPYRPWLRHLAKKGNVVVYPAYQSSPVTDPDTYTDNAAGAILDAIAEIGAGGHAAIDLDRAAITGHSYGGVIAANLAAEAASRGLPAFKAVQVNAPGTGGWNTYADYGDVPAGTLLLAIACDDDEMVGSTDAERIFDETTAVSLDDKDFVTVRSDGHGFPPLVASHSAPATPEPMGPDALDWRGFWKWFDALTDAAFYGTNRAYALGDTPEQKDMGSWSDGVPVEEPVVTDSP